MKRVCKLANCADKHRCRGYCARHYNLWEKGKPLDGDYRLPPSGRLTHTLYKTYRNMLTRCYSPSNKAYKDYGGRGITVCDEWLGYSGFDNFVGDMGARPEGLSLDRINNDMGYSPSNCRWATRLEQAANTRQVKGSTSGVPGVSWSNSHNAWLVRLGVSGKKHYGGYFKKFSEAVARRTELENQHLQPH